MLLAGLLVACQPALDVTVRNEAAENAIIELTTLSAEPEVIADPITIQPGEAVNVHIDPAVTDWSLRVDGGTGWFHSPDMRQFANRPGFMLIITERKELMAQWAEDP